MCGIAGAAAARPAPRVTEVARQLTAALVHRGPDGEGLWAVDETEPAAPPVGAGDAASIALGHRRLSIVDLAGGAQPMSDPDGKVWVTFNGEIYNHAALRRELEARGHRFRTSSDTEVLVIGWKAWGEALFGRLNGIFAFALFDTTQRRLVLVRDPVGVKPLYLGTKDGMTWWSSELGAARSADLVSGTVDPAALKLFLTFRFVPSPHTIFESVWKVPPGHYVSLEPDQRGAAPVFRRYQTIIRSGAAPAGRDQWSEAVFAEIEAAVTRQLMADVPVSSLLSGGVDSSLVTSIMTSQLPQAPMTFGIGFASDGLENEALSAQFAARCLGVPHHTTTVHDSGYLSAWPGAVHELGEPIANTGALLVRMICEQVGATHKVALSGQGADEPLGGYPRHLVERIYPYARRARQLSSALAERFYGGENGLRLKRALASSDRIDRYIDILAVIEPREVDGLVIGDGPSARELARAAIARWSPPDVTPDDGVNDLLKVDTRLSLADDLLTIGDHFSMRSGVELRVPFLDLELLDLLERMPSHYKISHLGRRKWLYSHGAAQRLPSDLSRRLQGTRRFARKRGFSTPHAWFESEAAGREISSREDLADVLPLSPAALGRNAAAGGPRLQALLTTLDFWAAQRVAVA